MSVCGRCRGLLATSAVEGLRRAIGSEWMAWSNLADVSSSLSSAPARGTCCGAQMTYTSQAVLLPTCRDDGDVDAKTGRGNLLEKQEQASKQANGATIQDSREAVLIGSRPNGERES